jgi:hypothetical protein
MVITEKEKEIPVLKKVGVLVLGGGPGGFAAAVSAARNGANVLLVERLNFLGGMAAIPGMPLLAFLDRSGRQVIYGIAQEFIDRLKRFNGAMGPYKDPRYYSLTVVDCEAVKYVTLQMAQEAGVNLLFDTYATMPIVEKGEIRGVLIENKSGRQAILADIVIDASGDADISSRAGAAFQKGDPETRTLMPMSLMFRMGGVNSKKLIEYVQENPEDACPPSYLSGDKFPVDYYTSTPRFILSGLGKLVKKAQEAGDLPAKPKYMVVIMQVRSGEVGVNSAKAFDLDGTDGMDISRGHIEARHLVMALVSFFKKYVPGFQRSFLLDTAPAMGIRDTRRIIGKYILTEDDMLQAREFDDTVARATYPVDIHQQSGETPIWVHLNDPYNVPFRCMVPVNLSNVLVAGRPISVDYKVHGSSRIMPTCIAVGQAAGTAAAMCLDDDIPLSDLNIKKLQSRLSSQGAKLD